MLIQFLDIDDFCKNLKPVTSTIWVDKSGEFHEHGLFSELIFGPKETESRRITYSFINLHCTAIHPTGLKILTRLDSKIQKFISSEKSYILVDGNLEESEDGATGISEFVKIFPKIKFRTETPMREKLIHVINEAYRGKKLFINKIPIIPPEFRPVYQDNDGNWIKDQINDHYLDLLRRSISIQSVTATGPFFHILNYNIQQSVINLDNYVRQKVSKKYGLIRSQLLGKRVDFSGRAVITCGPELQQDEIGIPLRIAVLLFEPFILHILLYYPGFDNDEVKEEIKKFTNVDMSVDSIKKVIHSIHSGDVIPQKLYEIFFEVTKMAMQNRLVLAKRDPVLHAESVRAFKPVLTRGNTIQLSNLDVGGFNADFDGDQMAVFHPLSNESQADAAKMTRLVSANSSRSLTFGLSKEACVGLYVLTKPYVSKKSPIEVSPQDLENAIDPTIAVKYKSHVTTMGKAILNSCLPRDFRFIDIPVTKDIVSKIFLELTNKYDEEVVKMAAMKLQKYGYKFATIFSPSLTIDALQLPNSIKKQKEKLDQMEPEKASQTIQNMQTETIENLKGTGLYDLVESGSTKGWSQPTQILIAKGIIGDTEGNILQPIKSSFTEGLKPSEYFKASYAARKGIVDKVINTADTGYITRQLVFLLNSIELDPRLVDCKTKHFLELKLTDDIASRLNGRYVLHGDKIVEFDPKEFKAGKMISLRSPVFCRSPKICHTCYGNLFERHKTQFIGVYAGQVVGEVGTQLTMRTFHTGGAVTLIKRNLFKDIQDNTVQDIMKILPKIFKVSEDTNKLLCLKPSVLKLTLSDYTMNYNLFIDEDNKVITIKGFIGQFICEDNTIPIVLDYQVKIYFNSYVKDKEFITINYDENDLFLEVPLEKQEIKESVLYTGRLLSGKETFVDINHLFMKLYKVYQPLSKEMDLVHLELLLSQCLRDKDNTTIAARLGKNPLDPVLFNIKKDIFSTSFLQGLSFENIGEAIIAGLTLENDLEPSIIEKILTGTIAEKEK